MSEQIIKDRGVEALKTAAGWPGADRVKLVTLASVLAATGADAEGSSYFEALSARQPDQPLPLALAGYFGVRVGQDIPAALAKLDDAAARDLGPAQYYRGLALAGLPPESGHAAQAVADLEFVLVVRDQFPTPLLRAVYHGLAAVYAALGKDDLAAQAAANSGLATAPPGAASSSAACGSTRQTGSTSAPPGSSSRLRASGWRRAMTSVTSPSSAPAMASSPSTRAPPPIGSGPP